jgi:hypothetical protein
MPRLGIFAFAVFLLSDGFAAGTPQEEKELSDALMRQLVDFVAIAIEEADPENPGICYAKRPNEHNQTPGYAMAWLYKNKHPLNPYFGRREIFDRAVAISDYSAEIKSTLEWPMYHVCQVYELLEDELDAKTKKRWLDYAAYYASTRGVKPFFYTSFNHEAWSALAVFRAGQVFGKPEWEEQGRRLMRQLLKIQTELGYFNEGPHHGPSLKYNHTQVTPMLLFADYANDAEVLKASKRLADFMIRYSFPDGSPMSTFDGRQSWSLGYYSLLCYGFDRWPMGKELNRRLYRTRVKWEAVSPRSPHFNLSDWYGYFGFGFSMDEYLSLDPDAPTVDLPQDENGYLLVERGPTFAGGVARNYDWMVAVSAIDSDIPRQVASPYRLERQSRLDVWHEKTGLIIGGGHNMRELDVPLANFHLLTGYAGVDCEFGELIGEDWHDKRAVYIPRSLDSDVTLERQKLVEHYGQGDLTLVVVPLNERKLKVAYQYDVFTATRLLVQLPLIVYHNTELQVDRKTASVDHLVTVSSEVQLSNPTMDSVVRITIPEGADAVLRPGVYPLRWYSKEDHPTGRWVPFYQIRLLSVQIDDPEPIGGGEFLVEILN